MNPILLKHHRLNSSCHRRIIQLRGNLIKGLVICRRCRGVVRRILISWRMMIIIRRKVWVREGMWVLLITQFSTVFPNRQNRTKRDNLDISSWKHSNRAIPYLSKGLKWKGLLLWPILKWWMKKFGHPRVSNHFVREISWTKVRSHLTWKRYQRNCLAQN